MVVAVVMMMMVIVVVVADSADFVAIVVDIVHLVFSMVAVFDFAIVDPGIVVVDSVALDSSFQAEQRHHRPAMKQKNPPLIFRIVLVSIHATYQRMLPTDV